MINIRRSDARGYADHGWLQARHSFSFAEYYDEAYLNYSVLRVMNEDHIAPKRGFGMHGHADMEIVTYVISGSLRHQDNMGNSSVLSSGDVQRMTAGTGVKHSEFNASENDDLHLFQIWLLPNKNGLTPGYDEKHFTDAQKMNQWCLIVSPCDKSDALLIHQDAYLYATKLQAQKKLTYKLNPNRCAYVQVVSGKVQLAEECLVGGDAATISELSALTLLADEVAEVLLFDLPKLN